MASLIFSALVVGSLADIVYTATFHNTNGTTLGTVTVNHGRIAVALTSNEGVDPSCYMEKGYGWHIHSSGSFPDGELSVFGADVRFANGHYDPGFGCSVESGNSACFCLNQTHNYDCQYLTDPFSCEFGDFSNKFEGGFIGAETEGIGSYTFEDPYLHSDSLMGKSVCFHCGDAERMFCGAFVASEIQMNSEQVPKLVSTPSSLVASFGFGYVVIDDFQVTVSQFNSEILAALDEQTDVDLAACAAQGFKWHIHDYWEHSLSAAVNSTMCGNFYTGGHYDPTLACGPSSGRSECGTCELSSSNYACDFFTDPYSCEVGDFSAKFGNIMIGQSGSYSAGFMPGLHILQGKSLVLHCGDTGARAVCAQLVPGSSPSAEVNYVGGISINSSLPEQTLPPVDCSRYKCVFNSSFASKPHAFALALLLWLFDKA